VVLEVVDIRAREGEQAAFEEAVVRGIETVVAKAKGFRGYKVNRGVESPDRFLVMIFWDTIDDHMVGFRESEAFDEWRAIVGGLFAEPPKMEHFTLVSKSA